MSTNNDLNLGVTPLPINNGGTGLATTTAYSVICAGTSSTGAFQSLSALGVQGQILTSNGASTLPSFQDNPATGNSPILYKKITLTPTDIKSMYSSPILLVSAAGPNTILIPEIATFEIKYNSVVYASGGIFFNIQWDSTIHQGGLVCMVVGWPAVSALKVTSDMHSSITFSVSILAGASQVNKGLYLSTTTSDYTSGDSTCYIHLYYTILQTTI